MKVERLISEALELPESERRLLARSVLASIGGSRVAIESSMAASELVRHLETVERTIAALPREDSITDGFATWLTSAIGSHNYPPALAGDLAHLLVTCENECQRLAFLAMGDGPVERTSALAQLWAIKFDLHHVLHPMIRELMKLLATVVPRRAREMR